MKAYKWNGYDIWWNNNTVSFPQKHIDYPLSSRLWEEITDCKFNWSIPFENVWLWSDRDNAPKYIKLEDEKGRFIYFNLVGIDSIEAIADDKTYYKFVYIIDKYMSYYWKMFDILLKNNVRVNFLRKFEDRFIYDINAEGKIETATFDFFKQKQFGNIIATDNRQMERNYIYSTNSEEIYKNNYTTPIPDNINFNLWNNTGKTISIPSANFSTPNSNGRYTYLTCKSSALINGEISTGSNPKFPTYADETKIIIPIFNDRISESYNGLLNIDITKTQVAALDPFGDNFIDYFECDIPYSLFFGLNQSQPSNCKLMYATNLVNGDSSNNPIQIPFFKIPLNFSPMWKIINYSQISHGIINGFDARFKNIIQNVYTNWNPDTDPYFLNPSYYNEKYQINNNNFISSDTSLFTYSIDVREIEDTGFSMNAWFQFDKGLSISYNYGNFTNTKNIIWNHNFSNNNANIETQLGIYGSAAANYYSTNASTQYTNIANRKSEQSQSWFDFGMNSTTSAISNMGGTAGGLAGGPTSIATTIASAPFKAVNTVLGMVKNGLDNRWRQQRENRQLQSQIKNIISSPSQTMTSPYIGSGIPNWVAPSAINETYGLFNTWSWELHDWDKKQIFYEIASNGYLVNYVDDINKYDNRKYMNVLCIDVEHNYDNLLNIIQKSIDNNIFKDLPYIVDFLAWISSVKRIYKTKFIINVIDYEAEQYLPNIENYFPPLSNQSINLNTAIKNTDIGRIDAKDDAKFMVQVRVLNPDITDDDWNKIVENTTLKWYNDPENVGVYIVYLNAKPQQYEVIGQSIFNNVDDRIYIVNLDGSPINTISWNNVKTDAPLPFEFKLMKLNEYTGNITLPAIVWQDKTYGQYEFTLDRIPNTNEWRLAYVANSGTTKYMNDEQEYKFYPFYEKTDNIGTLNFLVDNETFYNGINIDILPDYEIYCCDGLTQNPTPFYSYPHLIDGTNMWKLYQGSRNRWHYISNNDSQLGSVPRGNWGLKISPNNDCPGVCIVSFDGMRNILSYVGDNDPRPIPGDAKILPLYFFDLETPVDYVNLGDWMEYYKDRNKRSVNKIYTTNDAMVGAISIFNLESMCFITGCLYLIVSQDGNLTLNIKIDTQTHGTITLSRTAHFSNISTKEDATI